ncbi:hypothetical protein U9R90_24775 [Streptomyces sp. E11-3]|uniref:hypothetical protein n=1 Tax=Streptomyces sp. E11-3 TaxID=3110112 RepID=UPI0039811443
MAHHIRRYWRPAVAAAVASTLIAPISVADARSGRRAATCRSARDPDLAARMSRDIRAALSFRAAAPLAPHDDRSDLWCAPHDAGHLSRVGVARVLIVETVLRHAEELRRKIILLRTRDIRPMITRTGHATPLGPYGR